MGKLIIINILQRKANFDAMQISLIILHPGADPENLGFCIFCLLFGGGVGQGLLVGDPLFLPPQDKKKQSYTLSILNL